MSIEIPQTSKVEELFNRYRQIVNEFDEGLKNLSIIEQMEFQQLVIEDLRSASLKDPEKRQRLFNMLS